MIATACDSVSQEHLLEEAPSIIEKTEEVKLMVVDSVISNYRAEFVGRAELPKRQQRLNKFMHELTRLAQTYGVAVVVTNQIATPPDRIFGDTHIPTGGNIIAHCSNYRLQLRRSGRNRLAKIVKSSYHPEKEALFTIDECGVTDRQDWFPRSA